ncbi:unnamed protein product [Meloidogyne enterolobii]|uniref:Uncharacterized protein n=1 Tax=Meloidogyne enterolobii TaxID=390850 RepID=A0ACB1AAI4_MELEN
MMWNIMYFFRIIIFNNFEHSLIYLLFEYFIIFFKCFFSQFFIWDFYNFLPNAF